MNWRPHPSLVSPPPWLGCPLLLARGRVQGSVHAKGGHIYNEGFNVGGDGVSYAGGFIGFNGEKFNMREGEAQDVSGGCSQSPKAHIWVSHAVEVAVEHGHLGPTAW